MYVKNLNYLTWGRLSIEASIKSWFNFSLIVTFSRIANAMFLFGDHIVWLHRNKLIQVNDIKKWERFSNKSWLYSVILNLVRDYRGLKKSGISPETRRALLLDTLKNAADIWLPLRSLDHVNLSPFFVGLLGVISSILSALPIINNNFRIG